MAIYKLGDDAPTIDENVFLADTATIIGRMTLNVQTLEKACFDAFFMADHLAVLNMLVEALKRSHTATSFEPFTLLSALTSVTERIGLVATASTTFDEPYHIAREFYDVVTGLWDS